MKDNTDILFNIKIKLLLKVGNTAFIKQGINPHHIRKGIITTLTDRIGNDYYFGIRGLYTTEYYKKIDIIKIEKQ